MAIQTVNLGTAPTGAGGDTFRSTGAKINENFANNNHAASRQVGTALGNVMEVGAFGFGSDTRLSSTDPYITETTDALVATRMVSFVDNSQVDYGQGLSWGASTKIHGIIGARFNSSLFHAHIPDVHASPRQPAYYIIRTSANTTVDANGFIKAASPVIQLFTDKIQANAEALLQNPEFEKVDVGHYLIKGTEGFAQEGWWIEVPTDSNGNKICAVEYQTLDSGDLEVKTFKKKLNEDGDIVANLDAPVDIPSNKNGEPRWIDIRLHSTPKPIVQKILRTEKQPRMVQQIKYAPQLTYITKYQDLFDDAGNPVIVDGKQFQKPVTHIHTDQNGTPILTNQQVMNDKGEVVFEWVQVVDADNKPIFDDVPVLDGEGNQIYDEVMNESQQ